VQGGTLGNLSALVAAREHARSERGNPPGSWIIVCSAEAHSSVASAARVMDVEVVTVSPGESGVLTGDAVRPALAEHGDAVFAVIATAGSTNFGIVDDIASIAALKDEYDFWLHVDGAYGLAGMLSPLARPRFAGVERADSLIVDPHKWLFAPFDACALLYRDPEMGRRAHTQHAEYLDTLTEATEWSPSDYAAHLTRRARGLPFWFSLASHGAAAYRDAVTASLQLARRIADEIDRRERLHLVRQPQLSVVVFEREGWTREDYALWSARLLDEQRAFVTPSSHAGRTNTRFAILNPLTTFEDLVEILDSMED
jgi:glutamate/tyrosine decarboxylase-like PLP-dependent enzyme